MSQKPRGPHFQEFSKCQIEFKIFIRSYIVFQNDRILVKQTLQWQFSYSKHFSAIC